MSEGVGAVPQQSAVAGDGGRQMAVIVYILYFVGFFVGLTALAGVIVAHIKVSEASETFRSHFRYQIRTFWLGVLMILIGGALSLLFIGYLILLFWVVWTLIRCIKGVMRASDGRAIDDPGALLW